MNKHTSPPSIALQIALLRAKCVARRSMQRAVDLLLAVGLGFQQAARYVAACARRSTQPAGVVA